MFLTKKVSPALRRALLLTFLMACALPLLVLSSFGAPDWALFTVIYGWPVVWLVVGTIVHRRENPTTTSSVWMSLQPEIAQLTNVMGEMADLCEKDGNGWADPLRSWQSAILESNAWGLQQLLKSFGGKGSLSDVVLQSSDADIRDNERFCALREEAWSLAQRLQRSTSGTL